MSVAPSITWLLVTIVPSEVTITPEPRLCSRLGMRLLLRRLIAEELAEERIIEEWTILALLLLHDLRGMNVDHSRKRRFENRSQSRLTS